MFAGPEGLSVRDLIHQAAALQVAAWDWTRSRQTNVSGIIGGEPNFVHVGGSKYAHQAFPGGASVSALSAFFSFMPAHAFLSWLMTCKVLFKIADIPCANLDSRDFDLAKADRDTACHVTPESSCLSRCCDCLRDMPVFPCGACVQRNCLAH